MVAQPRYLGIDEGPFRFDEPTAVVVGVLTRGAHPVEAVLVDRVEVDGWDATDRVIQIARRLPGAGTQRVLIDGTTLGGLNLVDIQKVSQDLHVPVLAIARREPREGGLEGAAGQAGEIERRRALLPKSPPVRIRIDDRPLWVQAHDPEDGELTDPHQIKNLLAPAMAESATPEPLRLAHHIATAIVRGVSGTSP